MASLKSLAKDTAIYGLSSIVGRFLNYLLVPLYTAKMSAESGGYGVITNMYAYTALLLVILTYGMETTFFRYANKEGEDARRVYSTTLWMVAATSAIFVLLVLAFIHPISSFMGYADHPSYVWVMAATVALDAFQCIPFAYLRYQKRPIKFASLKLLFIVLNIALNLAFIHPISSFMGYADHPSYVWVMAATVALDAFQCIPFAYLRYQKRPIKFASLKLLFIVLNIALNLLYYVILGGTEVGYAFYINLACTGSITFCFWQELRGFAAGFDRGLMRRMLTYAWPILILGIAGILNQTADKILFPYLYKAGNAHSELGIYGAASKVAMIMAMITQAFRYAYEPFVFGKSKDKDNLDTYAKAMKYFLIFTLLAFLCVVGYMDILRHIIGRDYWPGLRVVPIVMAAEIMMGIYFNLSFWYKLIDKTIWGAVFSGAGCLVLIGVNVVFVPQYSYMACAWAGFAGYATAMILSYFVGQRKFPINYPIGQMMVYVGLAVVLFAAMNWANNTLGTVAALGVNTLLIGIFVAYTVMKDLRHARKPIHTNKKQ